MAGKFIYSNHALERLKSRAIDQAEVEYALENAYAKFPGKNPGVVNVLCDMKLGRKLQVSYKKTSSGDFLIITAYWKEGQP